MQDFDHKRFSQVVSTIDTALDNFRSREDFLMAASYMMTCCNKIFSECFGSEEIARAFMADYFMQPIDKDNLKKIV